MINGHSLPDGLAVVHGLHHRQVLGVGVDDIGHLIQNVRALGGGGVFPGRERLPGSVHCGVYIFVRGVGAGGQMRPVGGTGGIERGSVGGVSPLAADVKLILLLQFDLAHNGTSLSIHL